MRRDYISILASAERRRRFYARLLRLPLVSRSATSRQSLIRAAMWRHKVPRAARRKGSFLETFWCTTAHGFYSLAARSQMGRRDIKTGCARVFVPQECGLHTFPLFTLYSRLSLPGEFTPRFALCIPPGATIATLGRGIYARTYVRANRILQNLHVTGSLDLLAFAQSNVTITRLPSVAL